MEAIKIKKYTVEEYHALEIATGQKYEYRNGEVYAMSGGTLNHSLISNNITGHLRGALLEKNKNCYVLNSDMRIAVDFAESYVYADGSVYCNEPSFSEKDKNALTNPTLIIEVLSPNTRGYDRGEKFWKYKHLSSFKEYVIIEQKEPVVEVCTRQADGSWNILTTIGLDASVFLHTLGISIPMSAIYHGIKGLQQPTFRLYKEE